MNLRLPYKRNVLKQIKRLDCIHPLSNHHLLKKYLFFSFLDGKLVALHQQHATKAYRGSGVTFHEYLASTLEGLSSASCFGCIYPLVDRPAVPTV